MKLLALLIAAATLAIASPSVKAPKSKPVATNKKSAPKESKPTSLVLLYTCSARGQIRACNCTKFQFGGYGRQLSLLNSIRKENADVVMLEGGDSTAGDGFQAKLKAGVTSKALELLGYGAMVPGEQELGKTGIHYLDYFNPKSVPVICANVPDLCEKEEGYVPYIILKTKGNLRVGVIGLLDDSITQEMKRRGIDIVVSDPVASLKSLIHEVRAKSDLLVVVYHGTSETAGRIAEVNGTDFILCTHLTGRDFLFPGKSTNEVIATVEKSGEAYVVKGQTCTNWSLGRIDLTLSPSGKITDATHKLFYLDRRYDEDPQMVKVYDDYSEKVTQAVLDESKKMKSDMEVLLVNRGANLNEIRSHLRKSPFSGDGKCKECHADIHETWSKSLHAHAMETLDKTKQSFDPECVSCHVTGANARHGYSNKKDTPELANVQCEACHGPGLEHTKTPASQYGATGEETCRSCHTDERTPDFSYDEAWEKIKH
jgi:2',3'-cyclic-nucleotide 2'-phosphodiesterase (5'-nucleotidase family)